MLYIFTLEEGGSNKQLDEEGRKALVHELKDRRLRQEWGINGMALLNKRGSPYTFEKWTENFGKAAGDWGSEERAVKKVTQYLRRNSRVCVTISSVSPVASP